MGAGGWPFLPAMLAGVVAAVPLGAFFALPAVRARGIKLAIVTLGLGTGIGRPAGCRRAQRSRRKRPPPARWCAPPAAASPILTVAWSFIGGIGFLFGPIFGSILAPGSLGVERPRRMLATINATTVTAKA